MNASKHLRAELPIATTVGAFPIDCSSCLMIASFIRPESVVVSNGIAATLQVCALPRLRNGEPHTRRLEMLQIAGLEKYQQKTS